MKRKQYAAGAQAGTGMPLISLPVGRKNRANVRRRAVEDLGNTSAARIISECGLFRNGPRLAPTLFLSSQQGAVPFLKEFIKMRKLPYAVIGSIREINGAPICRELGASSVVHGIKDYQPGNVLIELDPQPGLSLRMEEGIRLWADHLVILLFDGDIALTRTLLESLRNIEFCILSANLYRGLSGMDPSDLLHQMEYIICGDASRDTLSAFSQVLPTYEAESYTNSMDFSLHRDQPFEGAGYAHRTGGGMRMGQTRSLVEKRLLESVELQEIRDTCRVAVYNAGSGTVAVAKIIG